MTQENNGTNGHRRKAFDVIESALAERGYTLTERLSKPRSSGPSGSVVYLAQHGAEPVVLKLSSYGLLEDYKDDEVEKLNDFTRRERETLRLAGSHPNIPDYKGSFTMESESLPDPVHVIAMQYLDMPSIAKRIAKGERISEEEAKIVLRDGASALNHLHTGLPYQVLHRDVKPSNVHLNGERAYLIDFDIVREGEDDATSATTIDTIGYYPQDAFSGHQNPGQDLVALGNVSIAGILSKEIRNIRYEQGKYGLEPVNVDGLPVSAKIRNYLGKLTSAPEQRFQTAREALEGLERILGLSARVESKPQVPAETQTGEVDAAGENSGLPEVRVYGSRIVIGEQVFSSLDSPYETLRNIRLSAIEKNLTDEEKNKLILAYLQHAAQKHPILRDVVEGRGSLEGMVREKSPSLFKVLYEQFLEGKPFLYLIDNAIEDRQLANEEYHERKQRYLERRAELLNVFGMKKEDFRFFNDGAAIGVPFGTLTSIGFGYLLNVLGTQVTNVDVLGIILSNMALTGIIGSNIQRYRAKRKLLKQAREVDSWIREARISQGLEKKVESVELSKKEKEDIHFRAFYYSIGAGAATVLSYMFLAPTHETIPDFLTAVGIGFAASSSVDLLYSKFRPRFLLKQKRKAAGLPAEPEKQEMREYAELTIQYEGHDNLKRILSEVGLRKKLLRKKFVGGGVEVEYSTKYDYDYSQTKVRIRATSEEKARAVYDAISQHYENTGRFLFTPPNTSPTGDRIIPGGSITIN